MRRWTDLPIPARVCRDHGNFKVSRLGSMPNDGTVAVVYSTLDGSAQAARDYTPSYGDKQLTFVYNRSIGGYVPQIIPMSVTPTANDDTQFSVELSHPYDPYSTLYLCQVGTPDVTATIADAALDVATMTVVAGTNGFTNTAGAVLSTQQKQGEGAGPGQHGK